MRIVLVGPASPWRGGIAHFNDLLTRELRRRHEVKVLTFTRQYPSLLFPGRDQKHASEAQLDVGAEPVLDSIGPLSWFRTAARIRELQPDLLVLRYWMPFFAPAFGTLLRRAIRGGAPHTVMIADNVVPHERRPLDSLLTRYALAPCHRFVCMSDGVRDDLQRFRPEAPVAVVPHPLYGQFGDGIGKGEARRRLGIDPDERMLLFFGFVRKYKGLDLLLKALPLTRTRPRPRLWVVGEFYDDDAPYRRLIAEQGLEDRVRLVDEYVANDAVAPWFCASDLVVLPYRHATQSGIVPVAYHLERPVLVTDVGGLGEVVRDGHSGLLAPPEDPAALAACIDRFYEEGLEDALVEGVRVERERFGWEGFADAVTASIS